LNFSDKKVIIFDLDGTLIDSVPDLALSINKMLTQLKRPNFSEEIIRSWVGNGAITLVRRAILGKAESEEIIEEDFFQNALTLFLKIYKTNLAIATYPYPFVIETLQNLSESGYILTIVTNKPFAFIEPLLKTLKMNHFFAFSLGADSLSEKKPSPLPLLYICEKFNITPNEAIMIGDSKNDIVSANRAKIDSVGVTYGYNYGEDINTYSPNFVVNHFNELLPLFAKKRN